MYTSKTLLLLFILIAAGGRAEAAQRFPQPDFTSGYTIPSPQTPSPPSDIYEYIDLSVLAVALALASYLILKRRSRRGVFALAAFCFIYFGLYRGGCICPIGSVQNVSLSIADHSYTIPLYVVAFFTLPILFALFFGRAFCSSVCPLGALQELVLIQPLHIPGALAHALSVVPFLYLGTAVLLAATGSGFLICRYDPFVGFFHLSANFDMLVLGGSFLVLSLFIGRPYCRFLCPYGAVLSLFSRLSKHRVTITAGECIDCRLCASSCPYGAILPPNAATTMEERKRGKLKLALLLCLFPVIVVAAGWLGSLSAGPLSTFHPKVRLAERIRLEETAQIKGTTDASDAFRKTAQPKARLYEEAQTIGRRFYVGSWILGAFIGLVIATKLVRLSTRRSRTGWEADRGLCFGCARCFAYCPVGKTNSKNQHPKGSNSET